MARPRDPFLVLGIARNADGCEIKRAYRRLVLALHPDLTRDPSTAERLRDVQWAYEILGDTGTGGARSGEAQAGDPADPPSEPSPAAPPSDLPEDIEPLTYSQWRHGFRFEPIPVATPAARVFHRASMNLSCAVDELFGGFVPELVPRPSRDVPKDLFVQVTLDAAEARQGATIPVRLPVRRRCPTCSGTGMGGALRSTCTRCGGAGSELQYRQFEIYAPAGTQDGAEALIPIQVGGADSFHLRVVVRVLP